MKVVRVVIVVERKEVGGEADGEKDTEMTQTMIGKGERELTTSLAPADGKERMMMKLQDPTLTCMNNSCITCRACDRHLHLHTHTQNLPPCMTFNRMRFKKKRDDVKALHATMKELQGIDPLDYLARFVLIKYR